MNIADIPPLQFHWRPTTNPPPDKTPVLVLWRDPEGDDHLMPFHAVYYNEKWYGLADDDDDDDPFENAEWEETRYDGDDGAEDPLFDFLWCSSTMYEALTSDCIVAWTTLPDIFALDGTLATPLS